MSFFNFFSHRFATLIIISVLIVLASCKKDSKEKESTANCDAIINSLKINQLQILGSHNSYRINIYEPLYQFILGLSLTTLNAEELDYSHEPLLDQLNQYGMRKFEIDIHHDPTGGRFYNRKGLNFINEPEASGISELQQPGMKVLHLADFDYNTHHYAFIDALEVIKSWSEAHSNHLPIYLMIEPKSESIKQYLPSLDLTDVLEFTTSAMDSIDLEIKMVFGNNLENVITPDDVRGNFSTLNEAILNDSWPTIGDSRGKVIFVLLPSSNEKANYLQGHPSLTGRAMFMYSEPGEPECAFVKHDDPVARFDVIQEQVAAGYIIRTRSDRGTYEARNGDYSRMNTAFHSGAQIISTDYYRPDPRNDTSATWTDYSVSFPNGELAVVNPVNGGGVECVFIE